MELTNPRKDLIVKLKKREKHSTRRNQEDDTVGAGEGIPKLPPKRNYIITMDRLGGKRSEDLTMKYVPKFHRVNVGNRPEVRYPITSSNPEFGSVSFNQTSPRFKMPYMSKPVKKPPFIVSSSTSSKYPYVPRKTKPGPRHIAVEELGEVWYPYLTSHPKYGSKQMVLGERQVADIYGAKRPTVSDIQEAEKFVLGSLDMEVPSKKPEWKLAFKGEGINRHPDPTWCGRYVDDKEHDFRPPKPNHSKTEHVDPEKISHYASTSKEVRFAKNSFNEKIVYTPQASGQYIERSFNPRIQKRSKGKIRYVENSFVPHYWSRNHQFTNKDIRYYISDPHGDIEEYDTMYFPPIKRRGRYDDIHAKVNSFANVDYSPGGGNIHYPTYKINWRTGAKVSSFHPLKSKSYPNTDTDSTDSSDIFGHYPEIRSELEMERFTESVRSHNIDMESNTSIRNTQPNRNTGTSWHTNRSRFSSVGKASPRS